MAFELKMPQLGLTMEEGTVSKWVKHEGDSVKAGDVVAEITTDKLTNELTSEVDGTLLKIVAQEGDDIPVKGTLAWIGQPGEQVGAAPTAAAPAAPSASAAPAKKGETSVIVIGGGPGGYVAAIRAALDENGFVNTPVMAYSAKFASTFYGPFRDAAGSAPAFGDRRSYQMDPHNGREAMRECELDVQEGADSLMIKPAMPYLDLVRACRDRFDLPVAAYQVSGEYAMIKAAAKAGLIDEYGVMCESAVSIFRAGADILITYFACELADAIRKGDIG